MQRYGISIQKLESLVGYQFNDKTLLLEALTHSTFAYENKKQSICDNERLEFLGDAVLELTISDRLFCLPESHPEGWMSKTRSLIVCENTLAELGETLDIGQLLFLGKGEDMTGGRKKPSNISNAVEAVFGAIYLDGGFDKVNRVILNLLEPYVEKAVRGRIVFDYKSRLLELAQSRKDLESLRFEILDQSGPVHNQTFTAGVLLGTVIIGRGIGSSKKEAEQKAAQIAYEKLMSN